MGGLKPRALTALQARGSLAHRLSPRVDRIRQIPTNLGLRSDRVFLVWTKYNGLERGEGDEVEVARLEILPTPRITDMTSIAMNPMSGGILPAGSIRVDRISARFNDDVLQGKIVPVSASRGERIEEPWEFFYETVSDGRSDSPLVACTGDISEAEQLSGGPSQAPRLKFRIASFPERDEGGVQFTVILERISEDRTADGADLIDEDVIA